MFLIVFANCHSSAPKARTGSGRNAHPPCAANAGQTPARLPGRERRCTRRALTALLCIGILGIITGCNGKGSHAINFALVEQMACSELGQGLSAWNDAQYLIQENPSVPGRSLFLIKRSGTMQSGTWEPGKDTLRLHFDAALLHSGEMVRLADGGSTTDIRSAERIGQSASGDVIIRTNGTRANFECLVKFKGASAASPDQPTTPAEYSRLTVQSTIPAAGIPAHGRDAPDEERVASDVVPLPAMSGKVVDLVQMLTPSERAALESQIARTWASTGVQLAVLIVPTTAPENINEFARRVAVAWRVAGRDSDGDGVLLVIAPDNPSSLKRLHLATGPNITHLLDDESAGRILREAVAPQFSQAHFYNGIAEGVKAIATHLTLRGVAND